MGQYKGWIKLHRKLLNWEWFDDLNTYRLFTVLLLLANTTDRKWRGINVLRGQLITSRDKLSTITGLSEQSIRTSINKLKSTNDITSESTSQYTKITICNYGSYQDKKEEEQPAEQPTSNQRPTITKEYKEYKEDRQTPLPPKRGRERRELDLSFITPEYLDTVKGFIEYRKEIKKPLKTERGIRGFYNELLKLSGNDSARADYLAEYAKEREWMTVYEIKNEQKTDKNGQPIYNIPD